MKEASRVIDRFIDTPRKKRDTRALDQETFLKASILTLQGELKRQRMKNRRLRAMFLAGKCLAGEEITLPDNIGDLSILLGDIDLILDDIKKVESSTPTSTTIPSTTST
ncbi:hypothetical protein Dimus_006737 [Dionaea muscipula]